MSQSTIAESPASVRPAPERNWSTTAKSILGPDWFTAYLFVLPMVLLLGGLIAYPFLRAVYMSFTNTVSLEIGPFVGFKNYRTIYSDHVFWRAFRNTVTYTVWAVGFKFALGLSAALLLQRVTKWKNVFTGLVLLPWIIPHVVIALTWRNLLDPIYGGVNQFLIQTGIIARGFPWLGDVHTAMPSVIMVNIWQGIPFFTIMMVAGLSSIDSELYEAASIDGANAWRKFLHVTLPGLRYVIIVAVLLSTIWTFNDFTTVYLLTSGGPAGATQLYSILSFNYAINGLRYGVGIAVAMTMAPILAVFIFFLGRYMSAGGRIREVETAASKTWTGKTFGQKIGYVISWPFVMLFRIFAWVFWLVHDVIETALGAIGSGISKVLGGGSSVRQASNRRNRMLSGIVAAVLLTLLILFELTPFYWVVITAFKTTAQWTSFESVFWPRPWSLEQFESLFGPTRNFWVWYKNTVSVSLVSTFIAVSCASLGAYGLTRLRWRGSNLFGSLVLVSYLMPVIMLFIPMYQILARPPILFDLTGFTFTNKLLGLQVVYPAFALPFATWLLMGYYASIPEELENAALIDGCNRFQAWYRIVLPLAAPALMAAGLFAITGAWKEFIFAYVFLAKESMYTLSVGLAMMIIGDVLPWGELMAAALLMAVPVVIIYMIGQRFMVAGLTAGAVKG